MSRRLISAVTIWLVACVALSAATVWDSKPFTAWTDAEVKKMLTSSPWSGMAHARHMLSNKTQALGLVTWSSARVMREAQARQRMGAAGGAVPQHLQTMIDTAPDRYVLTFRISGTGWRNGALACRAAKMVDDTFLHRDGKPPIAAEWAEGTSFDKHGVVVWTTWSLRGCPPTSGEEPETFSVITFYFPKTDPITAMDDEVEFVTKVELPGLGSYDVKMTFTPKDMTVNGKLQL